MESRHLANNFFIELKQGVLSPILEYVKYDDTLDLQFRGTYISIYYRGGLILKVTEKQDFISITKEYIRDSKLIIPDITNLEDYIPAAKHLVDVYLCKVRNHLWEKDIQQQIVKENNYSPNTLDTDYFVIDTEYAENNKVEGRFDIVALRWDSDSSSRGLRKKPRITIFEVKQGQGSIKCSSGIRKHLDDFAKLKSIQVEFIADMIKVFKQKRELGLIRYVEKYRDITDFEASLDFVFLIANYKSEYSALRSELESIKENCNLIYANAMGYGLYHKNIISKEEFITHFKLR